MNWIDLEEEWPHDGEIVLVCDSISEIVTIGKCCLEEEALEAVDFNNEIKDDIFTHWMPLPKPAKFIYG